MDLLKEMATLIVSEEQHDAKVAELLTSIKCVMADRHVVNRSLVGQLESLRKEVLPLVVEFQSI